MKKALIITIVSLVGIVCYSYFLTSTDETNNKVSKNRDYQGRTLQIAVIGDKPDIIGSKLIHFNEIEIEDIHNVKNGDYDAVFVMRDHLQQIAQKKYTNSHIKLNIPFFFIQSEKIISAFLEEELSYEMAPNTINNEFALGYVNKDNKYDYWEYGLYNDIENDENVQDVYLRIFNTIDTLIK